MDPSPHPPAPPEGLRGWVDYARGLTLPAPDCPTVRVPGVPERAVCLSLDEVRLEGDLDRGHLTLGFRGRNLSQRELPLPLFGPARVFAAVTASPAPPTPVEPRLFLEGDQWKVLLEPGEFSFVVGLTFEPRPRVSLTIPGPVARLVDDVARGAVRVDETRSPWHGGPITLESSKEERSRRQREQNEVTVRVTRVFHWGAVPTFEYVFVVRGVREQRAVDLPMLGPERIETLEPPRAYDEAEGKLTMTLPPAEVHEILVIGHMGQVGSLTMPKGLPFEQWLFETDPRHPVDLSTDGREIDPNVISTVEIPTGARAFFLKPGQKLEIKQIPVVLDEGRAGSGEAAYLYVQGHGDRWIGNLELKARVPKMDRMPVHTPAPPHYAERNGTAMRMFKDEKGNLSVQLDEAMETTPIRVQWRETIPTSSILARIRFPLPAQTVHLDTEGLAIHLAPGFVPVYASGADEIHGHLVDRFHVFALLMGLLAFVLMRAARFPMGAALVFGVLFASLDQVQDFPRTGLFVLLAATGVAARLPSRVLGWLREHRTVRVMLLLLWGIFFLAAAIPLVGFVQERIHSALHPWARTTSQVYADEFSGSYFAGRWAEYEALQEQDGGGGYLTLGAAAPSPTNVNAQMEAPRGKAVRKERIADELAQVAQAPLAPARVVSKTNMAASNQEWQAPAEKSMRPVALDQPHIPGVVLTFESSSLLPGQELTPTVLLAGPTLRRGWIFLEALLLVLLIYMIARGTKPLWRGRGPTTAGIEVVLALLLLTPAAARAEAPPVSPDGSMVVSPGDAAALDRVLSRLRELHRDSRWCRGRVCASTMSMEISGSMEAGRLGFEVYGMVTGDRPTMVPLFGPRPGADGIDLDGPEPAQWIPGMDAYAVLTPPGTFRLTGSFRVGGRDTVDLHIPGPVGLLSFHVEGARVLGDPRRRSVRDANFQLVPTAPRGPREAEGHGQTGQRLQIERTFHLGRDRTFEVVVKVQGARPGQVVALPLDPREKVASTSPQGAAVWPQGRPVIEFTAHDRSPIFKYSGDWEGDSLTLVAPEGAVRETWRVRCSDPYECSFVGDAETKPGAKGHTWVPLPGQQLEVTWEELEPMEGVHSLIQTVSIASTPKGKNLRQHMRAVWSSSASVLETITLPEGAVVVSFEVDGEPAPVLRDEKKGSLAVTLPSGRSVVDAVWEIDGLGAHSVLRPPLPGFAAPVGTVEYALAIPKNRSVLWTGGLEGSPEVVLWPSLATCLLLALLIWWLSSRVVGVPMGPRGWLVLGTFAGFAILSPYALLPAMAALLYTRWMSRGGGERHPLMVLLEILALGAMAAVALSLFFVVLHAAFFDPSPVEVEDFVSAWIPDAWLQEGLVDSVIRWKAGLAGATELPARVWAFTVPTLGLRLVWFVWAVAAGFFLYLEGRSMLSAITLHYSRSREHRHQAPAGTEAATRPGRAATRDPAEAPEPHGGSAAKPGGEPASGPDEQLDPPAAGSGEDRGGDPAAQGSPEVIDAEVGPGAPGRGGRTGHESQEAEEEEATRPGEAGGAAEAAEGPGRGEGEDPPAQGR